MNDLILRSAGSDPLTSNMNSPVSGTPEPPEAAAAPADGQNEQAVSLPEIGHRFVYAADVPDPGPAGEDSALSAAAELAAHKDAETPLSIGLFGGPGAGKSSALARLVSDVVEIGAAAERAGEAASFCPHIIPVRIDAADAAAEPAAHIASQIYDALAKPTSEGAPHSSLAREAVASLRDVHAVAREAADQLAQSRQRLETERRNLEDVAGRRARLAETVLFETPGTRVDSYARAHRSKIEGRLRTFGFDGDLVAIWKEFVREMAERNGAERFAVCAQSLWAYRGQTRLLVLTLLFGLVAWGLGTAEATRAAWVGWMHAHGGAQIGALGSWLDAHVALLSTLKGIAIAVALLCLILDVWRAARFLNPIFRGASLLKTDIEARRRDLDALLAHQTRRVDLLAKEVDAHARRADDAERRADGPAATASRSEEVTVFYGRDDGGPEVRARFAREFLNALDRGMARAGGAAPRLLVTLDGFEHLSPKRAAAFAETAGRLLARRGVVTMFAMDEERLVKGFGPESRIRLSRLLQIPVQISAKGASSAWSAGLLNKEKVDGVLERDARTSVYDRPLPATEVALVSALAPFAGPEPREIKRFVNLYRFARAIGPQEAGIAGALAVALLSGKSGGEAEESLIKAASEATGSSISEEDLQKARAIVSRLQLRGA